MTIKRILQWRIAFLIDFRAQKIHPYPTSTINGWHVKLKGNIPMFVLRGVVGMVLISYVLATQALAGQRGCVAGISEFVQITTCQLDAGEQTFEAFRILRSGMVEWARWNSSGHLLGHVDPFDMGSHIFDRVASSPSLSDKSKTRRADGVLGQPAFRLDIATLWRSGIAAASMTTMPDDIAALIDELRSRIKVMHVQPGWYVWTQPYLQIGKADIDLTEARRDSAIAVLLSEAIATGRLIVRSDDSIQTFITGERATRIAFEARLAVGTLLFGVLSAK